MLIISDISELDRTLSTKRKEFTQVSLVPTMGNLHEGHLKLVNMASKVSDFICVSIFVNPLQFGPKEDFGFYPRTLEEDIEKLKNTECSLLFLPNSDDILRNIKEFKADPYLSSILCGKTRPNHFDGVVTIVSRLFELFKPNDAFFGEKDYQQLMIIQDFVTKQNLNLKIHGVSTERESSGLAKSSRNNYLDNVEREKAALIYKTLRKIREEIIRSENCDRALKEGRIFLKKNNFKIDYLEALSKNTLREPDTLDELILLCAAKLNNVRLIDNLRI